jgi:azurin
MMPRTSRLSLMSVLIGLTVALTSAAPAEAKTLTIEAIAGLRYDTPRFRVDPGEDVKLTLVNADTMMHNLVITAQGKRQAVVEAAMQMGADGLEQDYVPESPHILEAIGVLNADQSATIRFTAPREKGVYPYVCTFPGHGTVMYGAMYVGRSMPALAKDDHVAPWAGGESDGADDGETTVPDAVQFNRPVVVRDFLPDVGPAAMAIGLPNRSNLAFDAGKGRVRYAWHGGFIKLSYAKRDGPAKLLGDVFYRADNGFPLRFGAPDREPEAVSFEGYRFAEDGSPVLHYTVDGVKVEQLIRPRKHGPGVTRVFRLSGVDEPVWFAAGKDAAGTTVTSPDGQWRDGKLKLSPKAARQFTITLVAPGRLAGSASAAGNDK